MSGSIQCPHTDVHFGLNQAISGDTPLRYLEITGTCKICDAPMRFRCQVMGSLPDQPAINPDGTELRLPFLFGDEKPTGTEKGFRIKGCGA